MRIILYAILIYFAYMLIFRLIIPVYLASRKIKQGFREMQEKMQEQMRQQQGFSPQPGPQSTPPNPGSSVSHDDYIEFEEVK
ncbi:MAG: hypothetical protein ACO25B_09670 [Chitinophagaceae bacterium]